MPRTTGQERRGGRILPHQRDTNDNAAILGGDLAPGGDYHENYNETVKHEMSDKARNISKSFVILTYLLSIHSNVDYNLRMCALWQRYFHIAERFDPTSAKKSCVRK